jgi:hypothetical protein
MLFRSILVVYLVNLLLIQDSPVVQSPVNAGFTALTGVHAIRMAGGINGFGFGQSHPPGLLSRAYTLPFKTFQSSFTTAAPTPTPPPKQIRYIPLVNEAKARRNDTKQPWFRMDLGFEMYGSAQDNNGRRVSRRIGRWSGREFNWLHWEGSVKGEFLDWLGIWVYGVSGAVFICIIPDSVLRTWY